MRPYNLRMQHGRFTNVALWAHLCVSVLCSVCVVIGLSVFGFALRDDPVATVVLVLLGLFGGVGSLFVFVLFGWLFWPPLLLLLLLVLLGAVIPGPAPEWVLVVPLGTFWLFAWFAYHMGREAEVWDREQDRRRKEIERDVEASTKEQHRRWEQEQVEKGLDN